MFKRALYLYIFFIFIQGVLASPQSFSTRIRGEVYLRNFVMETGRVPLNKVLLVRNVDSEVRNLLSSISVRVDDDKITVFPVDIIRSILAKKGIGVDVIIGDRVVFFPEKLSVYKDIIKKLVSFVYREAGVRGRIELGSLYWGLSYQLENLKGENLLSINFVMLDKKRGKGLLYVNYKTKEGETSVLKFVVNNRFDQVTGMGVDNANVDNTNNNGLYKGEKEGVVMVRSGMPVKIVFVNEGIVVRAEGYCVDSGKYFYGDTVKVKPVSTRKYFMGKVVAKGEVLVELK